MVTSNPNATIPQASDLRRLEDAVSKHVRVWIATLAEQWLRQRLAGRVSESQEASTACDTVGWLLREAWGDIHVGSTGCLKVQKRRGLRFLDG